MALTDESAEAFAELLAVMPSTITFNGVTRPCISQSLNLKRAQQIQGYQIENAQEVTMLAAASTMINGVEWRGFADFEGIKDRQSKVSISDGDELIYMASDTHPNSATIHLFLMAAK